MHTPRSIVTGVAIGACVLASPLAAAEDVTQHPQDIKVCVGKQHPISSGNFNQRFDRSKSKNSNPSVVAISYGRDYQDAFIRGLAPGKAEVVLTVAPASQGVIREGLSVVRHPYNVSVWRCIDESTKEPPKPTVQKPDPGKTPVPVEPAFRDNLRIKE